MDGNANHSGSDSEASPSCLGSTLQRSSSLYDFDPAKEAKETEEATEAKEAKEAREAKECVLLCSAQ